MAFIGFQVQANSLAPSLLHDKTYWSGLNWSKFAISSLMEQIPNLANPTRSKDGTVGWIKAPPEPRQAQNYGALRIRHKGTA